MGGLRGLRTLAKFNILEIETIDEKVGKVRNYKLLENFHMFTTICNITNIILEVNLFYIVYLYSTFSPIYTPTSSAEIVRK